MSVAAERAPAAPEAESVELVLEEERPGRIVLAEPPATLHLAHRYEIFRSEDGGLSWVHAASLPRDPVRWLATPSRLLCRLTRFEVRALARAPDGGYVASNRQGVFVARRGERAMRAARVDAGGLPVMPPMRITRGPGGEIVWGEYGSPRGGRPMRLFASRDGGESFQLVHALRDVLHVHNVVWDEGRRHYWVLTGDFDPQPGIGRLSEDLRHFEWFVRGEQRFRAVELFDFGDRLIYGTDSQLEPNALVALDKDTGRTERLRELPGSCIYACRFGPLYALTTSVEPSSVNQTTWAELWLSRDAQRWKRAWRARKDRWSAHYFQFGSIVLPSGFTEHEQLVFSGQAVEGLDGRTVRARLAPGAVL